MKDRYDQMAREELPEEEYQKVQHLLEIRTHKGDKNTFRVPRHYSVKSRRASKIKGVRGKRRV